MDMHENIHIIDLSREPDIETRRQSKEELARVKYHHARDKYDVARNRRHALKSELKRAESLLESVQAENDLLLDAVQIVLPSQTPLIQIMHQMDGVVEHEGSYPDEPVPSALYPESNGLPPQDVNGRGDAKPEVGYSSRGHASSGEIKDA